MIAGHGWYHVRLGHGVPWLPIAAGGFLVLLLALSRIPVAARALSAPGIASRLELPHLFRVGGVGFLITMALGHLPALFALPAGLGDIATGLVAPFVAYQLARGAGYRAARWLNVFGMTDLIVALTLGALTGFQLLHVTPSAAPITELPLALIPSAGVPLLFALHIISLSNLRRLGGTSPADPELGDHERGRQHGQADGGPGLLAGGEQRPGQPLVPAKQASPASSTHLRSSRASSRRVPKVEVTTTVRVDGTRASPVSTGLKPCTFCRYSEMKYT